MARTFRFTLSGPLLDQVTSVAANDEVEPVEVIRRVVWLWFVASSKERSPSAPETLADGLTHGLDEGLRCYQQSLDVYGRMKDKLLDLQVVAGKQREVVGLLADLEAVGDALSHLPELVENLRDERRVGSQLRRQAEEHGIVFRYDVSDPAPAVGNDP